MEQKIHIATQYGLHDGTLVTDRGSKLQLGPQDNGYAPYELLLGGLSFCLFSTFDSIAQKMQLTYSSVDIDVTGVKRDEKVATLKTCSIAVVAQGVEDEAKFNKAFEVATRYCSVFNTIAKVAEMEWNITFS